MDSAIRMHFQAMGADKLKEILGVQIIKLKKQVTIVEEQLKKLSVHRDKFKTLAHLLDSAK